MAVISKNEKAAAERSSKKAARVQGVPDSSGSTASKKAVLLAPPHWSAVQKDHRVGGICTAAAVRARRARGEKGGVQVLTGIATARAQKETGAAPFG